MSETNAPVGPRDLIRRFCTTDVAELRAGAGQETKDDGTVIGRGWCGYIGGSSRNPMISGFDGGYEFMDYLIGRGWKALASKGDWPYVIVATWARGGEYAVVEYVEADITVSIFGDREAARAFVAGLKDAD